MSVAGVVLAAGAGRRMGTAKALLGDDGAVPWLERAARALRAGGCDPVVVVLGSEAEQASGMLPPGTARVVVADDWADGVGASLRHGLLACDEPGVDAALVTLVDLPDVDEHVVARVRSAADGPAALVRAVYDGTPGHPAVIGRALWAEATRRARGDRGARDLFRERPHSEVECGDLASGRDVDTPAELARLMERPRA